MMGRGFFILPEILERSERYAVDDQTMAMVEALGYLTQRTQPIHFQ